MAQSDVAPGNMIQAPSRNLRALKIVVVVLGLALVLGFGALVVTIAMRVTHGAASRAQAPLTLTLPQEARVAHIALNENMLAVHIEKAGAEEILVVDLKSGKITHRVALSRE